VRLVLAAGGVTLLEAEKLDGLVVEAPAGRRLSPVGTPVTGEREEVDVPAGRVRELARGLGLPHRWFEDFEAMLAQVAPFGWYDAERDLVRAHVIRTSARPPTKGARP
jgi:hypothetical protein